MTLKDSFKNGRISPVISLAILTLFSIAIGFFILVGMLYLFDANSKETAEEERKQRLDNERDNRIQGILLNLTAENTRLNREAVNEQELILQVLEQQGNISKDVREKVLADIIRNNNETIPNIFDRLDRNMGLLLSLNNKIDEMPFLKNVTDPPTHVFNATERNITQ